jgi:HTH-type transcriptional regulator, osmoprotectant uptake regulator
MNPKEEFIELISANMRTNGFDEITSKVTGVLFIETKEISLEELAKKTGYSLSGVCNSLKFLSGSGLVKKSRKPGSRKVYLYMEKDLMAFSIRIMKKKYEEVILPSKQRLPEIIKKYKGSKEELKIIKKYYGQVDKFEIIVKKMMEFLEIKKKVGL